MAVGDRSEENRFSSFSSALRFHTAKVIERRPRLAPNVRFGPIVLKKSPEQRSVEKAKV
jgi:hypothetical protein